MVDEIMVGHDKHDDIPRDEQFPLWQAGRVKKPDPKKPDADPVLLRVYFSPDGQLQDKKGIFCTAVDSDNSYKEGLKWKTHREMKASERTALTRWRDGGRSPEERFWLARQAALNARQKETGLIPIKTKAKPKATHKRPRSSEDSGQDSYPPNSDDPDHDSNDDANPPIARHVQRNHNQRNLTAEDRT